MLGESLKLTMGSALDIFTKSKWRAKIFEVLSDLKAFFVEIRVIRVIGLFAGPRLIVLSKILGLRIMPNP